MELNTEKRKLERYRREALRDSRELCYDNRCRIQLRGAKTEWEISSIMKQARERKFKENVDYSLGEEK